VALSATGTLLVISTFGAPPFSARGLSQTLEPIAQALNVRRTVNGRLVNLTPTQFLKYKSKITCNDMLAPAIDGVFPGALVTIDCVAELAYRTVGGTPQRTIVDGSSRIEGDFTYYRPRLDMMVITFSTQQDEWGAAVSWSIDLEEAG
jgi:hypothetical protein